MDFARSMQSAVHDTELYYHPMHIVENKKEFKMIGDILDNSLD